MTRASYLKIVDHRGRAIPKRASSTPVFEGAAHGRRMGDWGGSTAGPDAALFGSLNTLRSRSRQLVRNDPFADGGMDTLVANLVGTGITPRWQIRDAGLKKEIQELWNDWVLEADWDGACDFYGLQALTARSMIEGGESLIRLRPGRLGEGWIVPLKLQCLEPDHLDHTYNSLASNGNEIRMGIEIDRKGRRTAYHLFREHPGEAFLTSRYAWDRVRIPASRVLHVFRVLRAGQMRGRPWLASAIVTQRDLNEYDDATIVRQKGAAMFGGFIEEAAGFDFPDQQPPFGKPAGEDEDEAEIVALEPGTFPKLPPGCKVNFSSPPDVEGSYEAFTKRQDRRIARGFGGLTYEKYTGDLTDVNYSSIRAGNLEFQRVCKMIIYNVLVFQFCRPVLRNWMDQAVLSRAIEIPDYGEKRREYLRVKWDIDGWEWVDPEKDVKAEKTAIRCGLKSRSQSVGERGRDAEAVDQEIRADNERADGLGNVYDSDPRRTDATGKQKEEAADE